MNSTKLVIFVKQISLLPCISSWLSRAVSMSYCTWMQPMQCIGLQEVWCAMPWVLIGYIFLAGFTFKSCTKYICSCVGIGLLFLWPPKVIWPFWGTPCSSSVFDTSNKTIKDCQPRFILSSFMHHTAGHNAELKKKGIASHINKHMKNFLYNVL